MIELDFEKCLQLLLEVEDQSIEPEDIPLLKVKLKQWQPLLSITFFQPNQKIEPVKLDASFEVARTDTSNNLVNPVTQGYVLIYLPHCVEQEIDLVWQQSPSKAWLLTGLAQSICRVAATKILGAQACLPLPVIDQELAQFMSKFGMLKAGRLNYKFALFSFYPAQGACVVCSLKENCPKI